MTNLIRRSPSSIFNFWDPDPLFSTFGELLSPRNELTSNFASPRVKELDDFYEIAIPAPGLTKKDFNVSAKQNGRDVVLTVSYETNLESTNQFTQRSFKRSWTLPRGATADSVTATYRNGILSVNVSKPVAEKADPTETSIPIK